MQNLIEKINIQVNAFIEQRQNLVMVLSSTDNEAGMVMKIIKDIEQADGSDVYFFFADDFYTQDFYVNEVIDKLSMQHDLANQEAIKEKLDTLPAPPSDLKDDKHFSPLQRLGKAMIYTRSLIPDIGAHNVIWILYPQAIEDRAKWHELVASFSPKNGIQDGMQGLRIIFRDLPDTLDFSPHLAELPRIQFNKADMSPEAIDNALEENIHDESLPDDQRFGAMLQKAMIDSAHSRFDQAYSAFKYMLGYYQHTGNHALQAVVINAVGDIYRRKSDFTGANHVYETAIGPAVKSGSATVLHNITLNLAENEFSRENFPTAEEYYDRVSQLASQMLYADGKIYALNQQAECAIQQDSWDRAVIAWEQAADFCRAGEYIEELEIELTLLTNAHQHLAPEKLQDYRQELKQLKDEA